MAAEAKRFIQVGYPELLHSRSAPVGRGDVLPSKAGDIGYGPKLAERRFRQQF